LQWKPHQESVDNVCICPHRKAEQINTCLCPVHYSTRVGASLIVAIVYAMVREEEEGGRERVI